MLNIVVMLFIFSQIDLILEEGNEIMEQKFLVLGSMMVGQVRGHGRLWENRQRSPRDSGYVVSLV